MNIVKIDILYVTYSYSYQFVFVFQMSHNVTKPTTCYVRQAKEAASVSKSLHYNGISTWFSFYDHVCKYINAKVDDPSAVVTLLSFLCEKFTVYWGNTISSFSKLDTYRSFKSSFCMEGYLGTISNRSHRVCYSKMRISNHRFAIETGRFRKKSKR